MSINDLKEKLEELFIRFNTSPKLYQKLDFLKLLSYLKDLTNNTDTGALHEDDLKTINDQSIVGEGNIEIPTADYTFELVDGKYIYTEGEYIENEKTIIPLRAIFNEQTKTITLL